MADRYEPETFEGKWRNRWLESDLFLTPLRDDAEKFYGLDFFPYPSGAGLSVGHCRNYVPTDVICRMKRMQGFNVLHPMGFDAFGLPAENEAIKRRSHPEPMIERYADTYHRQMDLIGVSYDWSRSFKSSDPSYYRWTQWLFELLYSRGLAYRKMAAVNWDPIDKTVLADEEVIAGRAERSGALVEKKYIPQWFLKITDYAQRLIDDLDELDWPEGIKHQQRNWIGRSEGVQFRMKVDVPAAGDASKRIELSVESIPPSDVSELERELRESGFTPQAHPHVEARASQFDALIAAASASVEEGGFQRATEQIDAIGSRIRGLNEDASGGLTFEVFTTRIDTIFGMSFCVLAPEHALVSQLPVSAEDRLRIFEYQQLARTLSDADRTATNREKTGVFTGAYAINPANGKRVPIWIADYVLGNYGTGAIMAVPGHDERDFEFAERFGLDIIEVIRDHADDEASVLPFVSKDGELVNSGEYNGFTVLEAQVGLSRWMEGLGIGERKIQYKLRDWLISRQRYWGCPIPIIHTAEGEMQTVHEDCLPVYLPMVEHYEPSGDGTSPLAQIPDFVNTTDRDGRLGQRETDTMGGFACSSWYFFRFCDPFNEEKPFDRALADYWMPVDCYVGGAEHAVMHLLYARFFTKVIYDAGLISVKEPFQRLQNQGQVLAKTPYRKPREDERLQTGDDGVLLSFEQAETMPPDEIYYRWARMSKSKGNVVTPDEMVERFGADALRLFLLFKAPFSADIDWENKGVEDTARFLSRVFRIVDTMKASYISDWKNVIDLEVEDETARKIRRATHQTIRNCTGDIDGFSFNTYVSWLMKYVNELSAATREPADTRAVALALSEGLETLILMLAPGAPFSADELWESIGKEGFTLEAAWPRWSPDLAAEDRVTIAVQVNGKLRDQFEIAAGADAQTLEASAKSLPKVAAQIEGKTIRKVVVVPNKLVNIVAN